MLMLGSAAARTCAKRRHADHLHLTYTTPTPLARYSNLAGTSGDLHTQLKLRLSLMLGFMLHDDSNCPKTKHYFSLFN